MPTSTTDRMPPRLSTGSVVSLTCAGTNRQAMNERDDRERQRHEEHRAPPEVARGGSPRRSGPSAAIAPPSADHSAIDRVRAGPGPQRGDQGEGRRVRHAGGDSPPTHAGDDEDLDRRGEGRERGRPDREPDAEQQHHLAAVPVAERAQPQHRRCEAERVADGDEVELGLRGVEREADRRQGDVGHGQVQVRDRRDDDQRPQDHLAVVRYPGGRAELRRRRSCASQSLPRQHRCRVPLQVHVLVVGQRDRGRTAGPVLPSIDTRSVAT